jgi:hypothetical protein
LSRLPVGVESISEVFMTMMDIARIEVDMADGTHPFPSGGKFKVRRRHVIELWAPSTRGYRLRGDRQQEAVVEREAGELFGCRIAPGFWKIESTGYTLTFPRRVTGT